MEEAMLKEGFEMLRMREAMRWMMPRLPLVALGGFWQKRSYESTNVAVDRSGMLWAACGDLTRRGPSPGRDPRHCSGKASADPHCRAEPRHSGGYPPQRG